MHTTLQCPECGAVWTEGNSCQDCFHQMGFWELEYGILDVHHLMVLSYHLQHPSLYSPDGLRAAQSLLVDFLERGITPQQVRQRDRANLDSGQRKFKIKATLASQGEYLHPVRWNMTALQVVAGGLDAYRDNVRAWATSVLCDLHASCNLSSGFGK